MLKLKLDFRETIDWCQSMAPGKSNQTIKTINFNIILIFTLSCLASYRFLHKVQFKYFIVGSSTVIQLAPDHKSNMTII